MQRHAIARWPSLLLLLHFEEKSLKTNSVKEITRIYREPRANMKNEPHSSAQMLDAIRGNL